MKLSAGIMIRMSIIGLEGRWGMEVLPMCSIAVRGREADARSAVRSDFMSSNWEGQDGL